MSRWYQNVLTGKQVEVKTLEEDDFYAANAPNWARIAAPSPAEKKVAPKAEFVAAPAETESETETEPTQPKRSRK
jgi:hypothetical protein